MADLNMLRGLFGAPMVGMTPKQQVGSAFAALPGSTSPMPTMSAGQLLATADPLTILKPQMASARQFTPNEVEDLLRGLLTLGSKRTSGR